MSKITYGGQEFDAETVQKMLDAGLQIGRKHDPASATADPAQLHGPLQDGSGNFGPFSGAGIDPRMYSAFQRPPSLATILAMNMRPSVVYNNDVDILTGVTAEAGTNADDWCGDPPGPGALKVCKQRYNFGDYKIKTDLNALEEIGIYKDYADVPRDVLNSGPARYPLVPDQMYNLDDRFQLKYEMWKVGVSMERDTCHVLIQGAAATAGANRQHGWITEFAGLDGQITTGYTDVDTSVACPAADSYVGTFSANVTGTAADGRDVVEFISDMVWGLQDRAAEVGMDGTQWVFVMRKDLFRALVATWACNYLTSRCTVTTNAAQNQDAMAVEMFRNEMMRGSFLEVDGIRYPVIFDECVPRETLGNQYYQSDLYFVPLSWMGNPLTVLEYFPMNNASAVEYASALSRKAEYMNNGLWLMTERDTGSCLEYHFSSKMRLILRTPFLAGRVDDLWYNFRAPSREAIPGASLYVDGGKSYITA